MDYFKVGSPALTVRTEENHEPQPGSGQRFQARTSLCPTVSYRVT